MTRDDTGETGDRVTESLSPCSGPKVSRKPLESLRCRGSHVDTCGECTRELQGHTHGVVYVLSGGHTPSTPSPSHQFLFVCRLRPSDRRGENRPHPPPHTHILPRNRWSILDSFHGKAVKAHSGRFTSCHLTVSCIFLSSGLCPAMLLPFLLIYQNPAFNPFPTSINTFQGASP